MNQGTISVVIPVLNEADKLERCLEAVYDQSYPPCQVIVVDGLSTDDTVERAHRFPVQVFYEGARSIARARQVGVDNAVGEYVAFTDADCVPERGWLEALVAGFGDGIVGVGGAARNVGDGLWDQSINLAMNTFLGGARTAQARVIAERRLVKSIGGFNSICRRRDIASVGGFDVRLPGGEDLDLSKRLSRRGGLLYIPDAVVVHRHSWTVSKFARKMFRYGKERGMVRAWDLQVVPPLLVPLALLSLLLTRWALTALVALYCALVAAVTVQVAAREGDARYLLTLPVACVIEHVMYSTGFWIGLARPPRGGDEKAPRRRT